MSRILEIINWLSGSKDIKDIVKRYLQNNKDNFINKKILDIPAGSGFTAKILKDMNCDVEAYDLLPDFFKINGMECKYCDLSERLPVLDDYADIVLCQEGLEHISDQLFVLKEFNRILKKGGSLFVSTPNYSALRMKLSYLLQESEYFAKIMPPNEIESIWFTSDNNSKLYYGHIFMLNFQRLRVLARIAGFRVKKVIPTRANKTSLLLSVFFYPFILICNIFAYFRAMKKNNSYDYAYKKKVFSEVLKYSLHYEVIMGGTIFVEFEKDAGSQEMAKKLRPLYNDYNVTT